MLLRCLVALVGGAVLAAGFEPVGLAALLPVGVALLVLAVRGTRLLAAALLGLLFGAVFMGTLIWWMRAVGPDAWIALSLIEAVFFIPLGMAIAILTRARWWPVTVAVVWVGIATWRGAAPFSGFTWGRLAFGTVDTVWAPSLALLGTSGVSLLIALTGTTLAWLCVDGRRRLRAAAAAVAGLAVVTLAPALGLFGVAPGVQRHGSLRVAAVQPDVPGDGTDVVAHFREITQTTADETVALAGEDLDLIVWPENSTAVDPFEDAQTHAEIVRASDAVGVPLLLGAMVDSPRPQEVLNQGIVWRPGTGAADRYTKRHPVPYGEYIPYRGSIIPDTYGDLALITRDMARGTSLEPLQVGDARVGDAICFDVSYDDVMLGQVDRGAEVLTVQTSNAMFIKTSQIDQQFEISRVRALETGRYVVVAAINGVSGIIAPNGSVTESLPPRSRGTVIGDVDLVQGRTPAAVIGPWLGRACVVLGALAIALGWLPYRRHQAERSEEADG